MAHRVKRLYFLFFTFEHLNNVVSMELHVLRGTNKLVIIHDLKYWAFEKKYYLRFKGSFKVNLLSNVLIKM